MNLTSQAIVNLKSKHKGNFYFDFKSMPSTMTRVRLEDERVCLNKIKPFEKISFENNVFYGWNKISFNMISCPAGYFLMGSDDENDFAPKRTEKIQVPFLLGETEVTQHLYKVVMNTNPSDFKRGISYDSPVENVTWYDAIMFCNKLSQMLGRTPCYLISEITYHERVEDTTPLMRAKVEFNQKANGFRLPTTKAWEYAAKAGTQNKWAGFDNIKDSERYAWLSVNFEKQTTRTVAALKPNEWGFYDMTGNVWEWCWDKGYKIGKVDSGEYVPLERSYQGASWKTRKIKDGISASPYVRNAGECDNSLGFRIAATI